MQAARSSRALRAEPRGGAPRARSGLSLAVSAQQRRSSGAAPSASASAAAAAAASAAAAGASRDYFATDRRPVILFDGVCNLCNTGASRCGAARQCACSGALAAGRLQQGAVVVTC